MIKMHRTKYEYESVLNAVAIDECSRILQKYFNEKRVARQEALRYILSIEEILLKYIDKNEGKELHVHLAIGTRFFRPYISLSIDGDANNVFLEYAKSNFQKSILSSIGIAPDYAYNGELNVYTFYLQKKKTSTFFSLGIAIILALIVGYIGLLVPTQTKDVLSTLLSMLHDTFLNMLGCVAGPMIFLSIAWGIYGIGDVATLRQIGNKMIIGYSGTVGLIIVCCGIISLPGFNLNYSNDTGTFGQLVNILSLLFGIVPTNLLSPFIEGNTLQIIFLAFIFGTVLIFLEKKTKAVAVAIEQLDLIVQFIIKIISELVPPFVFIVITDMIWSNKIDILLTVGKLFIFVICSIICSSIVLILYTSIRNSISPIKLVKKGLPTLIIGLSTASSAAAFGSNMKECRDELGIPENVYSFGLPLGIVTFKFSTGILYMMMGLYFAEKFAMPVSLVWIVTLFIVAAIIALATPPIPGGSVIAYTMLTSILGFSNEALAIALACDAIFDFILTGFDQFMMPFVLLNLSTKLGLTNHKILNNNKENTD